MSGTVNRNPTMDNLVSPFKTGRLNSDNSKQPKVEPKKVETFPNFDQVFGSIDDKKVSKELVDSLKKYATAKTAVTEISFVEPKTTPKTDRLPVTKNLEFSGDVSINEETDNNNTKVEGKITSGTVKVNFNNKNIVDSMKKSDTNILDFKYVNDGGKGSYSMSYDTWGPNLTIDLKTDKDGKIFVENKGIYSIGGLADGSVTDAIKKQLAGFGIQTKVENKDGKIFFTPTELTISDLPLSANGHSKGDVKISPNNAKFSFTPNGIEIGLTNADIKGVQKSNDNKNLIGTSKESFQGKVDYQANFNLNDKNSGAIKDQQAEIKVNNATSEINLRNPAEIKGFMKSLQEQFKADPKTADMVVSSLKKAGLAPDLVNSIVTGDDKKLSEIANNPQISDKLKQASIKLDLKNINLKVDDKGVKVNGENTTLSAEAKLDTGYNVKLNTTAAKLDADIATSTVNTTGVKLDGAVTTDKGAKTKVSATTDSINANGMKDVKLGNTKANLNVETGNKKVNVDVEASSINTNGTTDTTQAIKANDLKLKGNITENGVEFAKISAQAKELTSKISPDSKSINTKNLSVTGSAKDVKLSKEQIETVTNLINTTKETVNEKLRNIGLTEKQFIGIANAITNISKKKGSIEGQVADIAKNSGATKQQMKDIMELVSNNEFKSMLDDVDKISQSIKQAKDGKFNLNFTTGANSFSMNQQGNQLLTSAKRASLAVSAFSSDGKVKGDININTDSLNTETKNGINKIDTGKLSGNAKVVSGKDSISADGEVSSLNINTGKNKTDLTTGTSRANLNTSSGLNITTTGNKTVFSDREGKLTLDGQKVNAKYKNNELNATTEKIEFSQDSATVDKLSADFKTTRQQGQSSLRANVAFNSDKVSVNKGELSVKNTTGKINADFKSPVLNINDLSANVTAPDIKVKPDGTTDIPGLAFDKITGNARMSYSKLKKLIENNPSGKQILDTIKSKGINIPENQVLDFKLDRGAMKDGKLSGNISLPVFDADLGKAKISMRVDSTTVDGKSAKLKGNIEMKIDPDKFTNLLYRELGIDKNEIELRTVDGQVKAKMDSFLKSADVTVKLENDQLKINVDRAKLFKIIGISGMAKDKINEMLKSSNLHSVDDGKTLSVPLKELTDKFLDVKGLDISNVTNNGNTFNIPFSYRN